MAGSVCLRVVLCSGLLSLFGVIGVPSDFLIVTDLTTKTIQTNPMDTLGDVQAFTTIPLQGVELPVAVDYDPIDHKVYWTDGGKDIISRAFLNGTEQEIVVVLSNVSNPDGIALDVENRQLFWTDCGTGTIERANMDGSGREVLLQQLDEPRPIIADSAGRHIYWADWGASPKIERANFDGTERLILVDSDLQWPNGIAIDFIDGRIFWIDAGKNRLESVDLYGENREVIVDYMDNPDIHPFDVTLYMNSLYWTDWAIASIVEIGKFGTPAAALLGPTISRPTGIHIHQGRCQNGFLCDGGLTCIPSHYRCDSYPDCDDDTDELSCTTCAQGLYLCDNERCIPEGWACDHQDDCKDNSDEKPMMCGVTTEPPTTTQQPDTDECASNPCLNGGSCIDVINGYTCDCQPGYTGDKCQIGIDECDSNPCQNGGSCSNGLNTYICTCRPGYTGVRCQNDTDECASNPCLNGGSCNDGINGYTCDCQQGYTGNQCENEECPHGFLCDGGLMCISSHYQCDSWLDCLDGTDERMCTQCAQGQALYLCDDGMCIPDSWVCDRYADCTDKSDEKPMMCRYTTEPPTTTQQPAECDEDEFLCSDGLFCIPQSWRCDGYDDCYDVSDEVNCTECVADAFHCDSDKCIFSWLKCDGWNNCGDESDELGALCAQSTTPTPEKTPSSDPE